MVCQCHIRDICCILYYLEYDYVPYRIVQASTLGEIWDLCNKRIYYTKTIHRCYFLVWPVGIWPLIKSIFNIAFRVCTSYLLMHLWCHQQSIVTSSAERKPSEWGSGSIWEERRFIVIYEFVMSCKKKNYACTLETNSLCAHSSVIFVLIPLVASQLGK